MNRRDLLRAMAIAGAAAPFLQLRAAQQNKYLVLVELKGANDGLNTLVPYESDNYRKLRRRIGVKASEVIDLGYTSQEGALGLNNSMSALEPSIGHDLALITGVGYPNQNRSHFKSIALWETGGDGNRGAQKGWVTETLERLYAPADHPVLGATLQGSMGLFARGEGVYISMARLNQLADIEVDEKPPTNNRLLNLISKRKTDLSQASKILEAELERYSASRLPTRMPYGDLGGQLTDVMRVIGADLGVPVMHVQHGSFDTHEGQPWRHPRLLKDLAENLAAFRQGLQRMGRWDHVLVMTYSEFGRRAGENGNEGTDHGSANTHFMMGGQVNGGLYGEHPSLKRLVDGDMEHTLDYRAIYDQVCQNWFGDSAQPWSGYRDDALKGLLQS